MVFGMRKQSGGFRTDVLLAYDGRRSEFFEVLSAHASFGPGPELSEFPAIGCRVPAADRRACVHSPSPGSFGPATAVSWPMAGSGSGTSGWMLGNSSRSLFGMGDSSDSTPSW